MPTIYKPKPNSNRGKWTAEQLTSAIHDVKNSIISINSAAKKYGIPGTTLRRQLKSNAVKKPVLGARTCLPEEAEAKLVNHIKKLQAHGFAPNRQELRIMAFDLAERLKLNHRFNRKLKKAGDDWLILFLRRHPELAIRKAEGVSQARAEGMDKDQVSKYFKLLQTILVENDLIKKPGHIFNVDETGCQLNNRPEYVIAERGSKNVAAITSAEKGETITIIACCSAEGNFIPPACVFKGKNKKSEYEDGMPPGSVVYMGEKSAYVNTNLFYTWLKDHFAPRKPQGKVIILLDGHSSHCSNIQMLEFASANDIILFCLPPHTTQFLQPLDRGFFKSFKAYFYAACNGFMRYNPSRKINRLQFGKLLSTAWSKSATVSNGISAFAATGIYPFNPDIIPEYAYIRTNSEIAYTCGTSQGESSNSAEFIAQNNTQQDELSSSIIRELHNSSPDRNLQSIDNSPETPAKLLNEISPMPSTSRATCSNRKQTCRVLTSLENITNQKNKKRQKVQKQNPKKLKARKKVISESSSEEENVVVQLDEDSDISEDFDENTCVGCGENYIETSKRDDWIECMICKKWSHDSCTSYLNTCHNCGKRNLKK